MKLKKSLLHVNMRNFFILIFIVFFFDASGQSFVTYKDTINGFSIDIPSDWKYGVNKNYPTIKLIAYHTQLSQSGSTGDNLSINIFEIPNYNLDKTFSHFLKSLSNAKNFKLIDSGDTTFNGIKFKWLIESHTDEGGVVEVKNYDFVTFKDDKTFILTMVTFPYAFETSKPLLGKIASSFLWLN